MAKKPRKKTVEDGPVNHAVADDDDGPITSYPQIFLKLYESASLKFRTKDQVREAIGEPLREKVSLNWRVDGGFAPRASPKQLDELCKIANATPDEREELFLSWVIESGAKSKTKSFLTVGLRYMWRDDRPAAMRVARELYRSTAPHAGWPSL